MAKKKMKKYPKDAFAIAKRDLKAGQEISIVISGKQKNKDLKFLPHGKKKFMIWLERQFEKRFEGRK